MPAKDEETPDTIKRSPKKVQRTYEKTLDSAHEQYDSEEQAHRTAWSSVKHIAEKKGDHWELKDEKGPSDSRSKKPTSKKIQGKGKTFSGVDVEKNTKSDLEKRAKKVGIRGYSKMKKEDLARAIARKNG